MMHAHHRLWEQVEQQHKRHIRMLQELVQTAADGEDGVQQYVASRMRALGCNVETIRYFPQTLSTRYEFGIPATVASTMHTNVVGTLPGTGTGQSLLFFAHPDSEPIAGIEVWNHPPFAGEIDQGRLHGWGVADDLVGVAMMLAVLESVLSAGFKPKGTVILASTPSKRRAQGIISILNQGHVADGAVYLHPAESGGGLQEIKAVTSGLLRFRLTIAGKPPDTQEPSHTAFHHLAIDPLDKAWIVYSALRDLAAQRVYNVHYQPLEEAVGRSTNLHIAYMHYGDEDHLSRVSPACVLAGSLTFPPDESMDEVQRQVEQAIYTAAQQDTWLSQHPPALEWLLGISGAAVPIEHSLYQTAHQAILKITGEAPYVNPLHSTSDIRNPILHKGIPTIGFGPLAGNFSQAGHHDEWVDVEDYTRAIKVTGSIIVDWCGV